MNKNPRFHFRLRRHCAPLVTHGFSQLRKDELDSSVEFLRYYYGKSRDTNQNFTHQLQVNVSKPVHDMMTLAAQQGSDYKITYADYTF